MEVECVPIRKDILKSISKKLGKAWVKSPMYEYDEDLPIDKYMRLFDTSECIEVDKALKRKTLIKNIK